MKLFHLALVASMLAGAGVAFATERAINQKGKVFSEAEVTIKKGDSLLFVNDDNIIHNVMSTTAGSQFNLGAVKPGTATPVTFANVGDVQVICAIHPSMKMKVKVTD